MTHHLTRRRGLAALHAIAVASSRRSDAREIQTVAVDAVHEGFGADYTISFRVDRAKRMIVPEQHRGLTGDFARLGQAVPFDVGYVGVVLGSGRGVVTSDYANDPRAFAVARELGVKSVVAAPVALTGEVFAILMIASRTEAYDDEDLAILTGIGHQLACSLKVVELFQALDAALDRERRLVETVPCAVYEARCDGGLLYVSPKIEELLGRAPSELTGDAARFEAFVHPEDREKRQRALAALDREGARGVFEYRLLHANGRDIVWVADHAVARAARAGECPADSTRPAVVVTGAIVDIRERKVVEAAASEQSRLASLGELSAGIAHEINNPLSGVINYAQLLRKIMPQEKRLSEPVDAILAEADRILEVTRALVATARAPTDDLPRALDARELVRNSLTLLKQSLKADSIRLDVDVEEGLPPLRARGHELQQVLENLLTNARHALNARFPRWDAQKTLALRVSRVVESGETTRLRIVVQDGGCGIAPEIIGRIWDPFFTTRKDGTGLGLSITKRIVAAHGGTIRAESDPASGTTFTVELPVLR